MRERIMQRTIPIEEVCSASHQTHVTVDCDITRDALLMCCCSNHQSCMSCVCALPPGLTTMTTLCNLFLLSMQSRSDGVLWEPFIYSKALQDVCSRLGSPAVSGASPCGGAARNHEGGMGVGVGGGAALRGARAATVHHCTRC